MVRPRGRVRDEIRVQEWIDEVERAAFASPESVWQGNPRLVRH